MPQNVGGNPERSERERPGSKRSGKKKTKKKRERIKIKIGYSIGCRHGRTSEANGKRTEANGKDPGAKRSGN
eukprot:scaffold309711_cov39-Attheya_sp.AAC.1